MTESDNPIQDDPSCRSDHDPQSLPVSAAWERIRTDLAPVAGVERVSTRLALGRVLAEPVTSDIDVPAHDNAAMDGYALRGGDIPSEGSATLRCIGTVMAGHTLDGSLQAGDCVRIMTGAPMPAGADTVVMQENVRRDADQVVIAAGETAGQNVRPAGEDLRRGETVLAAGQRIGTAELGMLGSLGLVEVPVYRRLRVAFFSTGDELRTAGSSLDPGQIYDSNRYTLYAALQALGAEATDMGVIADDPDAMEQAFADAASFADAVITSGGVSVGEADFVKDIMNRLGQVGFWKIAMRPGRPLAFGTIGNARFFGLPGNPVSVVATWYQFVQPALRRMMGEDPEPPTTFRVRTATALRKRPGRTEFQRGILRRDDAGELVVTTTGSQGSGILRSVSLADCFIVLPHDSGDVAAGTMVDVQPFHGVMG
ncbi:gephyrin-like molybdotransferase Glp [Aquisalimonas asiatica]|uniref:Molybdopterin molybdenumtransferase n=1 Tax=Aquisalimonas asiatica TaxID=406100 RepID=A0A1H8RLK6_9GAMM|nr:gephyrin-like molybdotransferase Glp [Aquisalimonas asiatica]SEO67058.1 molybdopterin molybdochelatase [Aquisalimonas asiatica]